MRRCHRCGTPLEEHQEVFRASVCASCGADLRCCLNCAFYSRGAHWDCRESIDEPVAEKDRANFCSFFRFRDSPEGMEDGPARRGDKTKDAFDKLFGA